jgi:hypothetical protein
MTISTVVLPDFSRDTLLTSAIRLTGILGQEEVPSATQLNIAATHLNYTLDTLQTSGVILRTIERTTKTLTASTAEYTLDTDTIDIEIGQSDHIGTIVLTGGAEPIVKTMSRQEWLDVSNKSYAGMPTRCYLEKQATCKLVFWPVPDAAYVFRYTRVRLLKSAGNGGNTMDLLRTWSQYLVFAVAASVALDNSLYDRHNTLMGRAELIRKSCEAGDVQHGRLVFRVGHRGRNW